MSGPSAIAGEQASSPQWDSITDEITCPLCDYNLRGLTGPRCPECGFAFEWEQILHRNKFVHPFLFEHHPERNVWSFWKTLKASIRPFNFWKSISPAHEPKKHRLIWYWMSIIAFMILTTAIVFAARVISDHLEEVAISRTWMRSLGPGQVPSTIPIPWADEWNDWSLASQVTPWRDTILMAITWPWMTMLSLLVFQQTMKRSKIRSVQVLRCIIYSMDIIAWLSLAVMIATVVAFAYILLDKFPNSLALGWIWDPMAILCLLLPIIVPIRLWVAYRSYLKFKHPGATILASQVMVFLVIVNIVGLYYYGQYL